MMFREDRNKKLSLAERGSIVSLTQAGLSLNAISRQLGVSPATVSRWQNRFQETNDVQRKTESGRPQITTLLQDKIVFLAVREKPITTSQEIAGF